jgi:thiamine monophosphate synthase
VHDAAEAAAVGRGGGLDYLICGTIFQTASKGAGHRVSGLDSLARACAAVSVPVLAIGGITLDRLEDVAKAGAAGVAAIGLFIPPGGVPLDRHLATTVETCRRVFDTCGALP